MSIILDIIIFDFIGSIIVFVMVPVILWNILIRFYSTRLTTMSNVSITVIISITHLFLLTLLAGFVQILSNFEVLTLFNYHIFIWLILSYFQFFIIFFDKFYPKKIFTAFIGLIPPIFLSILLIDIQLVGWGLGLFIFYNSLWFLGIFGFYRLISGDWPVKSLNYYQEGRIHSLDFKMPFFTEFMNKITPKITNTKLKGIVFLSLIFITIFEFYLFLEYGYDLLENLGNLFIFETVIIFFYPVFIILNQIHEWGHIVGAHFYGRVAFYKQNLTAFVSRGMVDLPLSLYSPKERIIIALMGTIWTNFIVFIPVMIVLVVLNFYSQLLGNVIILIFSLAAFYAILSDLLFCLSVWPGGDMNNLIRDIYIIFSKKTEVPTIFKNNPELDSGVIDEKFDVENLKTIKFTKEISIMNIGKDVYYLIDTTNYSAYYLDEIGKDIIEFIFQRKEIEIINLMKHLQEKYKIETTDENVRKDINSFLNYFGKRGYVES